MILDVKFLETTISGHRCQYHRKTGVIKSLSRSSARDYSKDDTAAAVHSERRCFAKVALLSDQRDQFANLNVPQT